MNTLLFSISICFLAAGIIFTNVSIVKLQKRLDKENMMAVAEYIQGVVERLKKLPARPERKKGRWIDMGDFEQCSACTGTRLKEINTVYGKAIWIKTPYCPDCGAEMKEDGE